MLLEDPINPRHNIEGSENIDLDLLAMPNIDLESLVSEREHNKILLVTANLLDKLAVEITLKDLNIIDRFQGVSSVQEAVSEILSSWQMRSTGFAMVIIDPSHEQISFMDATNLIKGTIRQNKIPYMPKIVKIIGYVARQNRKSNSTEAKRDGRSSYDLCKPISKQTFTKMFTELNY